MDTRSISRRIMHPRHAPKRIENGRWLEISLPASCCFACVTTRGRERERGKKGRGGSYCLQSSPWNIESIGQVSSKFLFAGRKVFVFDTATTSISKLRQLWTTLYMCVYDRASILFLPRVKLAQFSLTSNAWPWLSFEQLFKSVCLTLRLPRFFFFILSFFDI